MSKILIVEDDRVLLRNLTEILTKYQYEVISASTYQEGAYCVSRYADIDLYLLDVWLPDGEGFDLCSQIRKKNNKPILFLTACDDEVSVVKGLDLGADDYVTKPFRAAELLSRIRTNIRRQNRENEKEKLICGDICMNPLDGTVERKGRALELRPVEYRLLYTLMKNVGKIVRRETLLEQLWDGNTEAVEDNTLTVHISRIRRKIGLEYIETIRGFGYRLVKPET